MPSSEELLPPPIRSGSTSEKRQAPPPPDKPKYDNNQNKSKKVPVSFIFSIVATFLSLFFHLSIKIVSVSKTTKPVAFYLLFNFDYDFYSSVNKILDAIANEMIKENCRIILSINCDGI